MKNYRMIFRFACLSFFVCVFSSVHAQEADTAFRKEWEMIDSLIIKRDLPKTALDHVNRLYANAGKRKLQAHVLKALIYRYSLNEQTGSNPAQSISAIETELAKTTDENAKALLHAILAKKYYQYYLNNRWNINSKSNTAATGKDIATWGPSAFILAIKNHYILALRNEKLLQQTRLATYDPIIIRGNARHLRPTLFDLIAHEALDYFKNGDDLHVKPVEVFTISDPALFNSVDQFLKMTIPAKDSSSLTWQAIGLFKRILAFHLNDTNKDALIATDLERLEWLYSKSNVTNKDQLYDAAIRTLIEKYPASNATAAGWYSLARVEANKASQYAPFGDTSTRNGYNRAEAYIKKGLSLNSDTASPVYTDLRNLLSEINTKELRTDVEKVNLPAKPFRVLVNYRNFTTLHTRIIRISDRVPSVSERWGTGFWEKIIAAPAYRSSAIELPHTNDHQRHAAEVKIDALPVGEYVLLTSSGNAFSTGSDKLYAHYFHVSGISYVQAGTDYFVLNRETGQPISNAKVAVLHDRYSVNKRGNVTDTLQFKTTDDKGHFSFIPVKPEYNNNRFYMTTGTDWLAQNESQYSYYDYEPENDFTVNARLFEQRNNRVFFFTDRAIYRPGQNVFFKGIAVTKDYETKFSKIIASKDSAWVYLRDVNYTIIDSIRYKPNSFGSFNGVFRLPQNTLTGNFLIQAAGYPSSVYFSVEEYKRPRFSAGFDKIKGAYRLNDSIVITGSAKAYAGNAVTGAAVRYRVTRNVPYQPYLWERIAPPGRAAREIAHGETTTDANGAFTIRFKALADDMIDRNFNPLFTFSIQADITDINGETRSATRNITAGFSALQLNINTAVISEKDSSSRVILHTTNMNNENEPANIQLRVYPLNSPQRLIRKRYWARPDQFTMTKEEFTANFPTDEYEHETNHRTWPAGPVLFEKNIATKGVDSIVIPAGTLAAGYYKIEASTKDKYGESVKQVSYTQVFDRSGGELPATGYRFTYMPQAIAEPGQTVSFIAGTSASRIYLIRKTEWPTQKKKKYEYASKEKGFYTIQHTAQESDRGGTFISEAYVLDNRVYMNQFTVAVPWSNKELKLTYHTYRNKTEPGSKEQWTIGIEGNKSDSSAAELLTAMYDASLDQFRQHNWPVPDFWPGNYLRSDFNGNSMFALSNINTENYPARASLNKTLLHDRLVVDIQEFWYLSRRIEENYESVMPPAVKSANSSGIITSLSGKNDMALREVSAVLDKQSAFTVQDEMIAPIPAADIIQNQAPIQVRKNFNETAFFFPALYADTTGRYSFSFVMPDAVTQWKWMSFAHTKNLSSGTAAATITTQKKMMVQPNAPRFMREGDRMEFSAKIANLTDQEIKGQATLELIDPVTNTSVDGWFHNVFPVQYFTVEAGQSMAVTFPVQIPFSYNKALTWRIIARSENISDGEENTLPVLTNRMLVTESLPLFLPKDTVQSFVFSKLLNNTSESLTHESITVEYTSNPVWYAVQALPYMIEFPYECAEQAFNRFYANTLASYISNKHPRIKQVFEQWKKDTTALLGNLQKNEELKQILLQETPWVLQAASEEQKKKNLAMLFDLARLGMQSEQFIKKLKDMQLPDGAFSWFKGGYADRYITNYILTGIGKLKKLGALTPDLAIRMQDVLIKAIRYMDARIADDYSQLVKNKTDLSKQNLYPGQLDYLYMRSFFADMAQPSKQAYDYYFKQARTFWARQNSYQKAQTGLIYLRNHEQSFAQNDILPALLENATEDKKGMYWKSAYTGFWYQSPVEHQSMMIAFAAELYQHNKDASLMKYMNDMKTWLLLNKQTSNWRTTVATADACYALLLNGSDWLNAEKTVTIRIGNTVTASNNGAPEAGTGYFKKRVDGKIVNEQMGNISVSVNTRSQAPNTKASTSPSWGSVYWQYFEDLDKITAAASPLSLTKKLFIEKNTDKGKVLQAVQENDELKTGDKIVVRIELRSDRDMDYLHLKDMRAASMEPVHVLSHYTWQGGLGYYESTLDASTNFFIDHLRRGTYVFEYPLFITHAGNYSVGIASIQCMYAPEFTSHSEGIRISVK